LLDFDYVLYGGAVGGGKSYWLAKEVALFLLKLTKQGLTNVNAGIFSKDYPTLEDRQLKRVEERLGDLGTLVRSPYPEFRFHKEYGGHIIMFRNLDDASKYKSTDFAIIGIEEINENQLKIFNDLRIRLRWPGVPRPKLIGVCNPIGEPWVELYWIKRQFPQEMSEISNQFKFIKSLPTDNPHLDPSYFKRLESLPEKEREAYLEGIWGGFESEMDEKGFIRLVSSKSIENAQIYKWFHTGYKVLGIDPGAGVDETSMVLRSDTFAEVLFNQKLSDTSQIKYIVAKLVEEHEVDYISIDRTGLGKPIYDEMVNMGMINVTGVSFAEVANDKSRFDNKKAEIFWLAKEWIESGKKISNDPGFRQLESMKYKMFDDKKIKMQSKQELIKAGIPSPNIADAFAVTFAISNDIITGYKEAKFEEELFGNEIEDLGIKFDFKI
jgi:hypothetical protein